MRAWRRLKATKEKRLKRALGRKTGWTLTIKAPLFRVRDRIPEEEIAAFHGLYRHPNGSWQKADA